MCTHIYKSCLPVSLQWHALLWQSQRLDGLQNHSDGMLVCITAGKSLKAVL